MVLNGEEIPDSNVIIGRLTGHFQVTLDDVLTEEKKGISLALQRMLENHTSW